MSCLAFIQIDNKSPNIIIRLVKHDDRLCWQEETEKGEENQKAKENQERKRNQLISTLVQNLFFTHRKPLPIAKPATKQLPPQTEPELHPNSDLYTAHDRERERCLWTTNSYQNTKLDKRRSSTCYHLLNLRGLIGYRTSEMD